MWSFFLCQLPTSENRFTFELTNCRLVHVLYPSLALPTSVNGRPTTLANTSTQNSKIYSRFSLFYDLSTKRLWKSNLRAKTTYHHSKILLILWHAKLLQSERSAGWEMASGEVVQLSTGFEKETSNSSPCCETGAGAAAIGTQMSRLRPNFQTLRTDCMWCDNRTLIGWGGERATPWATSASLRVGRENYQDDHEFETNLFQSSKLCRPSASWLQ